MNEEQLRTKINELIKTQTLREYLLNCLKKECELNNFLNLNSSLIYNAWHRLEKKIENCQQIEIDLPNELILRENTYLLLKKLDELRFQLAKLYAGDKADETIKKNSNYMETKKFILKLLDLLKHSKLKIGLTLNYFDLAIKLLEKIETGKEQSHKEFIGALDLLQKFVTEENYIPNDADLKLISDLGRQSNEADIRKSFYGIIYDLNKKLLFQDLLKQLLEIIENEKKSPLIQFSIIFIKKCLDDAQMDAGNLHQARHIMHSALVEYNKKVKPIIIFNKIVRNNLIDLEKFEEALQEKISLSITDNLANQSSQKHESVRVALILKDFDFSTFFTTDVNNKKIKLKLDEAKVDYNQTFNKKITTDNSSSKIFKEGWEKISSTLNNFITEGKAKSADAVENLGEIVVTRFKKFTSLNELESATSSSQEHEETEQIDLNNSLQAKEKLALIKEQLTKWNSTLNDLVKLDINRHNQIDMGQIKKTEDIDAFEASINEKYRSLRLQIPQILDEFEKINTNIKEKAFWLAKSELNKPSLAYKIFHRGYFNIDFSIKKFEAKLGVTPSFDNINNFISKQSFWSLLFTYGIVRWPWLKNNLALTWAEQLCLPDVITQIKKLKENLSINNNEDVVEKIILLLSAFPSYNKSQAVVEILNEFKKYIVAQLNQLERLELKINESLNKKTNLVEIPGKRNSASFFVPASPESETSMSQYQSILAPILVN